MANIFNFLPKYANKWAVVSSRLFSDEEKAAVKEASIVPSQYGLSVCFTMRAGGQSYIPLSSESTRVEGEVVSVDDMKLLQLHKEGEQDIYRVEC